MPGNPLKLIVGLGNPGAEHRMTRHNAGFWFVDALAAKLGGHFRNNAKFHGEICRVTLCGSEVMLLKPMTFMNRSGLAIRAATDFHKVPIAATLVVHDEIDLPLGEVRLKIGGGAGGHNGIRDTITHIGPDFWRLRIGVGHPGDKSQVIDHVLRRASRDEEDMIIASIGRALDALPVFIEQGAEKAMTGLHTRKQP